MKKVLGYGFKQSSEKYGYVIRLYQEGGGLLKSKKQAEAEIQQAKREGTISKRCRPKIIRVVVEVL
jgi:hypothetical protein